MSKYSSDPLVLSQSCDFYQRVVAEDHAILAELEAALLAMDLPVSDAGLSVKDVFDCLFVREQLFTDFLDDNSRYIILESTAGWVVMTNPGQFIEYYDEAVNTLLETNLIRGLRWYVPLILDNFDPGTLPSAKRLLDLLAPVDVGEHLRITPEIAVHLKTTLSQIDHRIFDEVILLPHVLKMAEFTTYPTKIQVEHQTDCFCGEPTVALDEVDITLKDLIDSCQDKLFRCFLEAHRRFSLRLRCGHITCLDCLAGWMAQTWCERSMSCPWCAQPLAEEKVTVVGDS